MCRVHEPNILCYITFNVVRFLFKLTVIRYLSCMCFLRIYSMSNDCAHYYMYCKGMSEAFHETIV